MINLKIYFKEDLHHQLMVCVGADCLELGSTRPMRRLEAIEQANALASTFGEMGMQIERQPDPPDPDLERKQADQFLVALFLILANYSHHVWSPRGEQRETLIDAVLPLLRNYAHELD